MYCEVRGVSNLFKSVQKLPSELKEMHINNYLGFIIAQNTNIGR